MKTVSILLAILGLALLTGLAGWFGAGAVLQAVLSVGFGGFGALVLAQLATDIVLGIAWAIACPGIGLDRLIPARIVREGATTCLPFSQLGGILLAIRATCFPATARRAGVAWPEASAANVVDVTVEVLGQILFVLMGLLFLLDRRPDSSFAGPVALGMALMAVAMVGFIWTQRSASGVLRGLLRGFGRHVAGQWKGAQSHGAPLQSAQSQGAQWQGAQWQGAMQDGIDALQAGLNRYYARPGRLALASLVHFCGWTAGAGWVWLAYHLLGAPIGFGEALAIEGVASGVLSVSFLVPAALGVQEAAYVALGSLFGIDPSLSFGLSLLRRGRDLAIGVPALLLWQLVEIRRLRHAAPVRPQMEPSA